MDTKVVCYHVTTGERIADILKNGLQPNSRANRSARKAPHIMLSLYPCWNLFKNWKKKQDTYLIEIYDPSIKREMFDGDPEGLVWESTITPDKFKTIIKYEVVE